MARAMAVLALLVLMPTVAFADKRTALVIGNSTYTYAGELLNPKNDATAMSTALKTRGFQVIEGLDLDKPTFDRKVREFSTALSGADVGVFFYAGHGLQVAGENYLVPIDAKGETADSVDFEMVPLGVVHRAMEREAQTNIIFLDACRNNPLSRNLARAMGTRSNQIGQGLAVVESGVGTLISFSTQPGNVATDGRGRNSPFARALSNQIATSADSLGDLLITVRNDVMNETGGKQVPWEHSAMRGRFYFGTTIASDLAPGTAKSNKELPNQLAKIETAPKALQGVHLFDGGWRINVVSKNCMIKKGGFNLSFKAGEISGGRSVTGRIAEDGEARFAQPSSNDGQAVRYIGIFRGDTGEGTYARADKKCNGIFTAARE